MIGVFKKKPSLIPSSTPISTDLSKHFWVGELHGCFNENGARTLVELRVFLIANFET